MTWLLRIREGIKKLIFGHIEKSIVGRRELIVSLVGAFDQEKALVGAFSVIVQLHRLIDLRQ